ncbi:Uncharacterised protein [Bordetella pertussis]|nr:Uncharacterised protein [Bordetella pertussis]
MSAGVRASVTGCVIITRSPPCQAWQRRATSRWRTCASSNICGTV